MNGESFAYSLFVWSRATTSALKHLLPLVIWHWIFLMTLECVTFRKQNKRHNEVSFPILGSGASSGECAVLVRKQCQQSSLWPAERAYTKPLGAAGLSWSSDPCLCYLVTGECDEYTFSYICESPLSVWGRNAEVYLSVSWEMLLGVCSTALETAWKVTEDQVGGEVYLPTFTTYPENEQSLVLIPHCLKCSPSYLSGLMAASFCQAGRAHN